MAQTFLARYSSRFWLIAAWLVILALAGGASREDDIHQIPVRLAAIVIIALSLWRPIGLDRRDARRALIFAGLCIALVALHLVPLPDSLWRMLPGRDFYTSRLTVADAGAAWRPLSLAPDLTWNALLSLLPALASLLAMLTLPREERRPLLVILFGLILVGCMLGLAQAAGGPASPLRFYRITNTDVAVGWFANRNHHAVLVAVGILLLGPLTSMVYRQSGLRMAAPLIALAIGFFLLLAILTSGSRSGLLLGILAAPLSVALFIYDPANSRERRTPGPSGRTRALRWATIAIIPTLVVVSVGTLALFRGRAAALSRLLASEGTDESRVQRIGAMIEMAKEYLPFGAGFGAFEPAYPRFEPIELLSVSYANEAHNDLVQIAIEGGVPALLLLLVFAIWWTRAGFMAFALRRTASQPMEALVGVGITSLVLIASLSDYPLRTPLFMTVFIMGCVLMIPDQRPAKPESTRF